QQLIWQGTRIYLPNTVTIKSLFTSASVSAASGEWFITPITETDYPLYKITSLPSVQQKMSGIVNRKHIESFDRSYPFIVVQMMENKPFCFRQIDIKSNLVEGKVVKLCDDEDGSPRT